MAKIRVLIVDDEEELVSILVERLRFRGYEAVGVLGGNEAIAKALVQEFDVAVIDVKMPEINGIETLRRLKKIKPSLKIILLTGHRAEDEGEEGLAEGAFDYLIKPVNIEDLTGKINAALALENRE